MVQSSHTKRQNQRLRSHHIKGDPMLSESIKNTLTKHHQERLLSYLATADKKDRNSLLEQIGGIDWFFLTELEKKKSGAAGTEDYYAPVKALTLSDIRSDEDRFRETGVSAIRDGRLGLLLLAGGQGTRLGYDKPKGCFNMGIDRDLFIFELLIEHTMDVVRETGCFIPLFIMTSDINYGDTVWFFEEHNFFGYDPSYIHFFKQELYPVTDFNGQLLLQEPGLLALSPNGNGGWFSSMEKAGLLPKLKELGIDWLNVFSVDNVLQRIGDPVFLGATIESGKACGAKVVYKNAPDERVGAICTKNGHPYIIEYYELSEEMQNERTEAGTLSYGYGVILNYLFPVNKLKATLTDRMPLHIVEKKVPYIDETGVLVTPDRPNAYKYETLALDLIAKMDDCLVFEVEREKDFAPVKNATGVDSVDTARELLRKNGYAL